MSRFLFLNGLWNDGVEDFKDKLAGTAGMPLTTSCFAGLPPADASLISFFVDNDLCFQ